MPFIPGKSKTSIIPEGQRFQGRFYDETMSLWFDLGDPRDTEEEVRDLIKRFHDETEHSAPTTPPAVFELPATGGIVPARFADITLKVTGHMAGREGWATSVDLKRGRTVIGEVRDDGYGGGADFRPGAINGGGWKEWLEASKEMEAILEGEPLEIFDGIELPHSSGSETLANRLIDEALLAKQMNAKRVLVLRFNRDIDDIRTYPKDTTWEKYESHFVRMASDENLTIERWVKGEGWSLVSFSQRDRAIFYKARENVTYTDGTLVQAGDKARYHQAPGGLLPHGDWQYGVIVAEPAPEPEAIEYLLQDDKGRKYNLFGHVIERV